MAAKIAVGLVVAPTVPAGAQRVEQLEYELGGSSEPVIEALVRTTAPFNLVSMPTVAVVWCGTTAHPETWFPGSGHWFSFRP